MKSSANAAAPGPEVDLAALVARCRVNDEMMAAMAGLYRQVDRVLAAAGATCLGGGACCKFDLAGHRLYLTVAEAAFLTLSGPPRRGLAPPLEPDADRARRGRCPYQYGPSCMAYTRRPLGCRTFFCRVGDRAFLEGMHERFHRRIAALHEKYCVPYAYGEMCEILSQLPM